MLSRIQTKMQSGSQTNFSREGRREGIWVMNGIMIAFTSDHPKLKLNGKRRGGGGGKFGGSRYFGVTPRFFPPSPPLAAARRTEPSPWFCVSVCFFFFGFDGGGDGTVSLLARSVGFYRPFFSTENRTGERLNKLGHNRFDYFFISRKRKEFV